MKFYFGLLAPTMSWQEAKNALWRSVEALGKEGTLEKEQEIMKRISRSSE